MKLKEILGVTLNTSILAVFYTTIGGILSYLLGFFVEHKTPEWEKRSMFYQIGDVSFQLAIIGAVAFWVTYVMKTAPPIFPIRKGLDEMVDTYISGVFFAYALFLFVDYLDDKIKFIYNRLIGKHLERMFPMRKTNKNKTT
jgi:hypothetical protein